MGVEIVLHQHDLRSAGKMRVQQFLEDICLIDCGLRIRHFDMPPAFERHEHHEQIGCNCADIRSRIMRVGPVWCGFRRSRPREIVSPDGFG